MTTSAPTSPTLSIGWQGDRSQQCDPDFSFPAGEVRYRVPLWVVGAIAATCVSLLLTRSA